jgi:general secretion pathway protein K
MPRPADPRPAPGSARDSERGIALVVVLWTLVMLAMLTIGFSLSSRTEARVAANGAEQVRLRALLHSGVELAVLGLGTADDNHGWLADGTAYPVDTDGGRVTIRIRDEAGRIDLNRADADTLQRLIIAVLGTPETAPRLAAAILHRRGTDPAPAGGGPAGRPPPGQANSGPQATPPPITAAGGSGGPGEDDSKTPGRPFQSPEELRQVPGITRAIADALMPHVTVLSPAAAINPFAADRLVLQALPGVGKTQAEAVVRARRQRPAPTPERLAALLPPDAANLLRTTAGPIFAITVDAATSRGGRGRVEAVIWIAPDQKAFYRILDWREAGFDPRPGRREGEDPA